MRAIILALTLSTASLPSQALAQECNPSDVSHTGVTICANANFRAADAKLSKAYADIISSATGSLSAMPSAPSRPTKARASRSIQ
jgi:uncharacterized protein YecT (DUF1311 family)